MLPVVLALLSVYGVYARNETIHACELVVKCFQDAEFELMQCQNILLDSSAVTEASGDEAANNESLSESLSTQALPSDDCMNGIKQKIQQKRVLIEQRAEAFALCLNERMDNGPEDVEQRKFRYCNTVISRYNARTTGPPDLTLPTTVLNEQVSSDQQEPSSSPPTAKINTNPTLPSLPKLSPSSNATGPSTRSTIPATRQPFSLPNGLNIRPPRQAPTVGNRRINPADAFAAVANATVNRKAIDIKPPAAASPPGVKEQQAESTEAPGKVGERTTDSLEVQSTIGSVQQSGSENESGRAGAVSRFASNRQPTATKEQGQAVDKAAGKSDNVSTSTPAGEADGALGQSEQNNAETPGVESPPPDSPDPSDTQPNPAVRALPASVTTISPENNGSVSTGAPLDASSTNSPLVEQQIIPDNGSNSSITKENGTSPNVPVLVPQEQQIEVNLKNPPLESVDAPPQEVDAGKPQSGAVTSASGSLSTLNPVIPLGINGETSAEVQRNRAETLRDSRRRVSEFKACMARARIKREECKPIVNCCPDSVKCHLRYEVSELHDQIHRLELEISEGRQACLEKKKAEDDSADALDQIDEEDLVSDESVVSQQVF